jgi:hypothetical protein
LNPNRVRTHHDGVYVPPKYYYQVGDQVKKGIGTLLVNISRSVEKAERKQRQHISKMGQELDIDGLRVDE